MSDGLAVIGTKLKGFRKTQGLNQSEVAAKTAIHRQIISEIERGQFTGSLSTLLRYLNFANMELTCTTREEEFPQLDDLDALFEESD